MTRQRKGARFAAGIIRVFVPRSWRGPVLGDLLEEFDRHHLHRVWRSAWLLWQATAISARFLPQQLSSAGRAAQTFGNVLGAEARLAGRLLLRRPGLPLACIATLSLGTGATTTVFSWSNGILLNPYPAIPDSGGLLVLASRTRAGALDTLSYPDFDAYREHATALRDVVGTGAAIQRLVFTRDGHAPERLLGHAVSGNYFDALQVPMETGRGFRAEEDRTPGTHPVAVIGHGLWTRRFGGDPAVVGATLHLNSQQLTVVGVASPAFRGTLLGLSVDVWTPLMMQERLRGVALEARDDRWIIGLGRVREGVSRAAAESELRNIGRELEAASPIEDAREPALIPIWRSPWGAQGGIGPVLAVLAAIAVLVLLLASTNVATLLLARAAERRREFAIRMSLGGGRERLFAQLLAEGMFMATGAVLASVVVARWSEGLLTWFIPPTDSSLSLDVSVDGRVMLFAAALALPTTLLVSLAPALQTIRPRITECLREEDCSVSPRSSAGLRRVLLIAQVSAASVFLVGTALLMRSVQNAQSVSPGFTQDNVLLATYDLAPLGGPATGTLAHARPRPGSRASARASRGGGQPRAAWFHAAPHRTADRSGLRSAACRRHAGRVHGGERRVSGHHAHSTEGRTRFFGKR